MAMSAITPTNACLSISARRSYANKSESLVAIRSTSAARSIHSGIICGSKKDSKKGKKKKQEVTSTSSAAVTANAPSSVDIDWDNLGFGLTEAAFMFCAKKKRGSGEWEGGVVPFGDISLNPSAGILNYGQGVFEGMKAYRTAKDRIVVFRPDQNAARIGLGADRMCLEKVPEDMFIKAVIDTVAANKAYVPPLDKGAMYIRPLLIGNGPILGLAPAPECMFLVYVSPVGAYFKGGQLTPIDLVVSDTFHRAAPGGAGGTKCVGNYAQVLVTQLEAKGKGYADVVYLDAKEDKYIEEVSSCNMFVVKGKTIRTPPAGETILSGITRKSVIQIAKHRGYEVIEERVPLEDVLEADEVFCTGTAVVVVPVGSITYKGDKKVYCNGEVGTVGQEIYTAVTNIQYERAEDEFGWVVEVPEC